MLPFLTKPRKKTKLPQLRYLYLMKRVPQFSQFRLLRIVFVLIYWSCPLLWFGRYKIGISNNARRRRREIDNDLKGGIVTVLKIPVYNAIRKESSLHALFSGERYTPRRAGKAAGRTEHFKLNFFQILQTKILFLFFLAQSNIVLLVVLAFIVWRVNQ